MKVEASDINLEAVGELLQLKYGVEVEAFEFVPHGEESYSYVVRTSVPDKIFFVKLYTNWHSPNLEMRLAACYRLRDKFHLEFVVPALPGRDGRFLHELSTYSIALFNYVNMKPVANTRALQGELLRKVAQDLAKLHEALWLSALGPVPFHKPHINFQEMLQKVIAAAKVTLSYPDPIQKQAAELICRYAADLVAELKEVLQLEAELKQDEAYLALTHGDMSAGNILVDENDRVFFIDWSRLAIGPAERDLIWFVNEHNADFLQAYQQYHSLSNPLRPEFFEFYLRGDVLAAISDYGHWILLEDTLSADIAFAWDELKKLLPLPQEWLAKTLAQMNRQISTK